MFNLKCIISKIYEVYNFFFIEYTYQKIGKWFRKRKQLRASKCRYEKKIKINIWILSFFKPYCQTHFQSQIELSFLKFRRVRFRPLYIFTSPRRSLTPHASRHEKNSKHKKSREINSPITNMSQDEEKVPLLRSDSGTVDKKSFVSLFLWFVKTSFLCRKWRS